MEDIKNISKHDSNKNDLISIRMLKLYGKSICKPHFPIRMEKYKCTNSRKNNKVRVENWRLVSFLWLCSKVFKRIVYNTMFPYFIKTT